MLIRRDENELDKLFRQKLYDTEEATPLHLWEGIRQKTQRKKRGFYWFSIAAAAIIVSGGIWFFMRNNTTPLVSREFDALQQTSPENGTDAEHKQQPSQTNSAQNTVKEETNSARKSETTADVNTDQRVAPPTNASVLAGQQTNKDHSRERLVASKNNINTPGITKRRSSKKTPAESHKANVHLPEGQALPKLFISESPIFAVEEIPQYHTPASAVPLAKLEDQLLNDEPAPMAVSEAILQQQLSKNKRWQIGLYGLLTTPYHFASEGHNAEQFDALISRTITKAGTGIGVGVSYSVLPGLSIGAGIEAYSFLEEHSWQDTSGYAGYFQEVTFDIYYPYPDSIPIVSMAVDTVYQEALSISTRHLTNKYSGINVPLILGVHRQHNKLTYGLEIGPVLRLYRGYRGSFVFPGTDLRPYSEGASNQDFLENFNQNQIPSRPDVSVSLQDYYTRWKTDIHVGLQMGYQLKPNLSAGLSIFYRQSIHVIDKGSPLAHRMVQPGLRLGLNYHF